MEQQQAQWDLDKELVIICMDESRHAEHAFECKLTVISKLVTKYRKQTNSQVSFKTMLCSNVCIN